MSLRDRYVVFGPHVSTISKSSVPTSMIEKGVEEVLKNRWDVVVKYYIIIEENVSYRTQR